MGVSFDSPEKNETWAEDEGFSFDLWTDDDKTLALTYGAVVDDTQSYTIRITRILDTDGDLLVEYDKVAVGTNPADVLEDCQTIFAGN